MHHFHRTRFEFVSRVLRIGQGLIHPARVQFPPSQFCPPASPTAAHPSRPSSQLRFNSAWDGWLEAWGWEMGRGAHGRGWARPGSGGAGAGPGDAGARPGGAGAGLERGRAGSVRGGAGPGGAGAEPGVNFGVNFYVECVVNPVVNSVVNSA